MCTKVTIKHRYPVANRPGFHLYDDVFDDFGDDPDIEAPVYPKLEGVAVELRTRGPEGDWVTLTIPRELSASSASFRPCRTDRLGPMPQLIRPPTLKVSLADFAEADTG